MKEKDILRILDANFNRCREGLRVCEEITRFVLEDKGLTKELKVARHSVTACLKEFAAPYSKFLNSRDSAADVGKSPSSVERLRKSSSDLFLANMQRAKESLRVLEEISKLVDGRLADKFKKIRFKIYVIEKKSSNQLEALCDH